MSTPVSIAKRQRWAELRAEHAQRMHGTFTAGARTFPIDQPELALALIDAYIAQRASEAWSQRWSTADGDSVVLNATQMLALGRARRLAVAGLGETLEGLRQQLLTIDNTTGTLAQVAAVVWPA